MPQLLDVWLGLIECSAAEMLSGCFFFFLTVVSQRMPPSYLPPAPHCALMPGHKGVESVGSCYSGENGFYSK